MQSFPIQNFCVSVLFEATLTKLIILFPAIATVVTVAEILKNNGFAVEKSETLGPPCLVDYLSCVLLWLT